MEEAAKALDIPIKATSGIMLEYAERGKVFKKWCAPSNAALAVNPEGREIEMAYQVQKRTRELKRDVIWDRENSK